MTPVSPYTQAAIDDAVIAACCFHLPHSPTLAGGGIVRIVEVDLNTPEQAVKARIQKRFDAPCVVEWHTPRLLRITVMYPPRLVSPTFDFLPIP